MFLRASTDLILEVFTTFFAFFFFTKLLQHLTSQAVRRIQGVADVFQHPRNTFTARPMRLRALAACPPEISPGRLSENFAPRHDITSGLLEKSCVGATCAAGVEDGQEEAAEVDPAKGGESSGAGRCGAGGRVGVVGGQRSGRQSIASGLRGQGKRGGRGGEGAGGGGRRARAQVGEPRVHGGGEKLIDLNCCRSVSTTSNMCFVQDWDDKIGCEHRRYCARKGGHGGALDEKTRGGTRGGCGGGGPGGGGVGVGW